MSDLERQESNLGLVLGDLGYAQHVPDPRLAQSWSPGLSKKLVYLHQHADHYGLTPHVRAMVGAWHRLVEKYADVSAELGRLRGSSTVYYSVTWTNIPAASVSSLATSRVPYSGTPAILRDILLNSDLTPVGGFDTLNMAGINFADPTVNAAVITYDTAPGVAGTPIQRYMDPTPFLHDKTAPWGGRSVQFWVDWVLDPAAQIVTRWVNPDPINAVTVSVDYLFTSSPCSGLAYHLGQMWHRSQGPQVGNLLNSIHTAVFGLTHTGLPQTYATLPIGQTHQVPGHSLALPAYTGPR